MTHYKCYFPCGEHPGALPAGEFARQSDGAVVATMDEAVVRANGIAP
jgi:polyribonucleotide nucleotidyltransferase